MAEVASQTLAAIAGNRDLVIAEFGPLSGLESFGLDEASVAWVEGYIERQRQREPDKPSGKLATIIGCWLGEAIIAAAGGRWDEGEHGLGVLFATGDTCYPIAKVHKQFQHGLEGGESILSFYRIAVDYVAKGKLTDKD